MLRDNTIQMSSYNHVRDTANISFLSPKGKLKSIYIHADTFNKLMEGILDKESGTYGEPSLDQKELREAAKKSIKKDFSKWFKDEANRLSKESCNAGHSG